VAEFWIRIDTGDARHLAEKLHKLAHRGVPYATRNTLNDLAFEARKRWKGEMEERFILRNHWTVGSVRVDTAKGTILATMQSRVGSIADYMGLQERGGTKTGGKHGVRVPTAVAAGQGVGTRPRTKQVRGPNRMSAIQLAKVKQRSGSSSGQQVAAAVRQTIAAGKRFVFLESDQDRQGMYKLVGGKRKPRLQLVWDMSAGAVRVPSTPTLWDATNETRRHLEAFAVRRIREQLRLAGISG
jgi:hypothetical protein